jgi:hypothetical protein
LFTHNCSFLIGRASACIRYFHINLKVLIAYTLKWGDMAPVSFSSSEINV